MPCVDKILHGLLKTYREQLVPMPSCAACPVSSCGPVASLVISTCASLTPPFHNHKSVPAHHNDPPLHLPQALAGLTTGGAAKGVTQGDTQGAAGSSRSGGGTCRGPVNEFGAWGGARGSHCAALD